MLLNILLLYLSVSHEYFFMNWNNRKFNLLILISFLIKILYSWLIWLIKYLFLSCFKFSINSVISLYSNSCLHFLCLVRKSKHGKFKKIVLGSFILLISIGLPFNTSFELQACFMLSYSSCANLSIFIRVKLLFALPSFIIYRVPSRLKHL